MRNTSDLITIFNAKNADGAGLSFLCEDFETVMLQLGTTGSANMTVKFQGSLSDTCPDFSAAQSPTNHWNYIAVIDLQSGSAVTGNTGVAFSAADANRQYEANVSGMKWICAIISSWSAGYLTLKVKGLNN